MRHSHFLIVFTLATVSLVAQRVWTVDLLNRPGTDFLDLPQAYAAVAPGDVLRVRQTPAQSLSEIYIAPVIDGKGVSILGESPTQRPVVIGRWLISNVPVGETLVIANLALNPQSVPRNNLTQGITATDNAGALVFDHCTSGYISVCASWHTFTRCSLVTMSHCSICSCAVSITFEDCLLHANDTEFREGYTIVGSPGDDPLFLRRTTAHLANCYIQGAGPTLSFPMNWSYGMRLCNSIVYLSGRSRFAAGVSIGSAIAGDGSIYCYYGYPGNFRPIVYRDPSTTFFGYYTSNLLDDRPGHVAALTLPSVSSTSVTITQFADPGSLTLLAASTLQPLPVPGLPVTILLDPASMFVLDIRTAGPIGQFNRTISIPPGVPPGTMLGVQGLELTTGLQLLATNAMAVGAF